MTIHEFIATVGLDEVIEFCREYGLKFSQLERNCYINEDNLILFKDGCSSLND